MRGDCVNPNLAGQCSAFETPADKSKQKATKETKKRHRELVELPRQGELPRLAVFPQQIALCNFHEPRSHQANQPPDDLVTLDVVHVGAL
jgi:hypothetical protein